MCCTSRWDLLKWSLHSSTAAIQYRRALISGAQKWNRSPPPPQRYELLNSDMSTILLAIMIRHIVTCGNKGHASRYDDIMRTVSDDLERLTELNEKVILLSSPD